MEKDYFLEYLIQIGIVEYYNNNGIKLSALGKAYRDFVFFDKMGKEFEKSYFYKKLVKEGKI